MGKAKKKKYVRVTDGEVTLWTKDSIKIFSDSIQGYREIYDVMLQELMIYGHQTVSRLENSLSILFLPLKNSKYDYDFYLLALNN